MAMYLIIGRSGSGKTYFSNLLENQGFKRVISRTTRPKRDHEDKDSYIWLNEDEANKQTDRISQTKIGNYQYFTLADDLKNKDMYVIDPQGMYDLTKNTPDVDYHIVYLKAKNEMLRAKHTKKREDDSEKAKTEFRKRNEAEDKQFSDFEKILDDEKHIYDHLPQNIQAVHILENDYTPESNLEKWAVRFYYDSVMRKRLANMVKRSADLGITRKTLDDKYMARVYDTKKGKNEPETVNMTAEVYAESLLRNNAAFDRFIVDMLTTDENLDKIYPGK